MGSLVLLATQPTSTAQLSRTGFGISTAHRRISIEVSFRRETIQHVPYQSVFERTQLEYTFLVSYMIAETTSTLISHPQENTPTLTKPTQTPGSHTPQSPVKLKHQISSS